MGKVNGDQEEMFGEFAYNSPAEASEIARLADTLGFQLPAEYADYLQISGNGGEGFIGDSYLILWRLEELMELNNAYQVEEYVPELLLIGSDGGDDAYAIERRSGANGVFSLPFVGMDLNHVAEIAPSFSGFLQKLYLNR